MSELFVKINDQQEGPFSPKELRDLATKGKFTENDLVFMEDENHWVRAGDHREFISLFHRNYRANKASKIFAVGGGKGGVGKTVTTASLGVGLAALGYRVILVDADLGGANLHTCMGILEPQYTFYHFYSLQRESLNDIVLETPVENLQFISGACGTLGLANPRYSQKLRFISSLRKLDADIVLLDLGAGASYNVIDFFLAADERIIVTTPEPTAIQETFNFVKIAAFRSLQREFKKQPELLDLIQNEAISEPGRMGLTVPELLHALEQKDPDARNKAVEILEEFIPKLILNMVHEKEEIKEGAALKTAIEQLLGLDTDFLGSIEFDDNVRNSVKNLKPYLLSDPKSKASKSLAKLISVGLLRKTGWQGYKHKRRVLKTAIEESNAYPMNQLKDSQLICSVNCFYWGDCDFQNGGYQCPVRHLDPIFKR